MAYTSTYGTTRIISQIISLIGWACIIIGGILLCTCVIILGKLAMFGMEITVMIMMISLGFILVISGQTSRALIDTSDNTGEILSLMLNKKKEDIILLTDEVKE